MYRGRHKAEGDHGNVAYCLLKMWKTSSIINYFFYLTRRIRYCQRLVGFLLVKNVGYELKFTLGIDSVQVSDFVS